MLNKKQKNKRYKELKTYENFKINFFKKDANREEAKKMLNLTVKMLKKKQKNISKMPKKIFQFFRSKKLLN